MNSTQHHTHRICRMLSLTLISLLACTASLNAMPQRMPKRSFPKLDALCKNMKERFDIAQLEEQPVMDCVNRIKKCIEPFIPQAPIARQYAAPTLEEIKENARTLRQAVKEDNLNAARNALNNYASPDTYPADVPLLHITNNPAMVDLLVKYNANVNITKDPADPTEDNALWGTLRELYCVSKEREYLLAKTLIRHGVNIHHRNIDGETPLHFNAYERHNGFLKDLLEAKADINAVSNHGNTPLHKAVSILLWNRDVSSTTMDRITRTALLLISAGADQFARNTAGNTALDRCSKYYPRLRDILLEAFRERDRGELRYTEL